MPRVTPDDLRRALVDTLRDLAAGVVPTFEEPAEPAPAARPEPPPSPKPEIEPADVALHPEPAETVTPATLDQFDLPNTPQNVAWLDSTDPHYSDAVRHFRRLDLDEFCERLEDGRRSFVVAHHARFCTEAELPREETPRPRGKTFFANCNGWNCRCPVTFHADGELLQ